MSPCRKALLVAGIGQICVKSRRNGSDIPLFWRIGYFAPGKGSGRFSNFFRCNAAIRFRDYIMYCHFRYEPTGAVGIRRYPLMHISHRTGTSKALKYASSKGIQRSRNCAAFAAPLRASMRCICVSGSTVRNTRRS